MNNKKQMVWRGLALGTLMLGGQSAFACGPEDYMGSVCAIGANFCPRGTLEANGALLPISSNTALFSLLGTTYGGDGMRTFGLPNLQGRAIVGRNPAPGGVPTQNTEQVPLGDVIGSATTTLSVAELPAHSHTFNPAGGGGTVNLALQASTGNGQSNAPSATNQYMAAVTGTDSNQGPITVQSWSSTLTNPVNVGGLSGTITPGSGAVGTTGSNSPVPTQSPSQGLLYCVVAQGVYPTRP